jgi:ATP-binding cassette subfamily B protein
LILDESTSALDASTESAIIENLRNMQLTLLFATHRTHNLKSADHIIVLDSGQIAESGTHKALVDLKGLYFNFFSAQEKTL